MAVKRVSALLLSAGACALVASTVLVASQPGQSDAPPPRTGPVDKVGAERFTRLCNTCHDSKRIAAMRRTSAEWEEAITAMISKGLSATDAELQSVFEYLLATSGRLDINKTTNADEITLVLGLSKKDAQTILDYRTKHGHFADLDALKKVPGIDVKLLDEGKDAITF